MARIIQREATGPYEVKPSERSTWICMCGLSTNDPICDGSHKLCRQQETEGKLYRYVDGQAEEIESP